MVQTKNGPVEDHVTADKNAITSANLLTGTAGLSASHDGFKIGTSFARCETENPGTAGSSASGTAGSRASHDRIKIGTSFARCEPDAAPSRAQFTVQDVLR